MKKFLILFFTLLLSINQSFSYELFYPKEKKMTVTNDYAFFYGKARKTEVITINDKKIFVAQNGAFAHSVKLKNGENRIIIKSNFNKQIYKFNKNPKEKPVQPKIEEFDFKTFAVKGDNTPLRETPVDYGMNRISHLFQGTKLIINGQCGDFYRVFLTEDKTAWIMKKDVTEINNEILVPKFITMNSTTYKNASSHTIEFSDKLPYTINEYNDEILFKVYNPFASDNSVYTVNIKKPEKYYYKTILNNGNYTFKVNELCVENSNTFDNLTIIVDPGHGGLENGAIGCLGDKEKDINLAIATELKNKLALMGANVIMTRECDGNTSLDDRVKIAKDTCAEIFVSIHLNSIPDIPMNIHQNRGTSVYYYNKNSKQLAEKIETSLVKSLGTRNDGVKTASFAVLRPTEYIGVLVEVAYMTNPLDTVIYKSDDFVKNSANSIAEGVLNYINSAN